MILQKLLFPEVGKCTEEKLYFRFKKNNSYVYGDQFITFSKNETVKFDTYFNGLSIDKWKKYTNVDNFGLTLKLKGHFIVTLTSAEKIREDIIKTVVREEVIKADEISEYTFLYTGNEKGILSFMLKALADNSVYYGGYYSTNIDESKIRNVKIGICICTFKREDFIENNMRILNKAILENQDSELNNKLEIFISDNGKSLDIDKLSSSKIHIFPNRNLGGAGGFTRGLLEIKRDDNKYNITHALLMDDDIVIEPEAIEKTYKILSLVKDEYVDAFIGGAMLRRDKQSIQVESGAVWNGGYLNSLKAGLDMSSLDACLYNELEEYNEFNAWWYCCFPVSVVRDDNLPLPIFIRGDDLEYGLRNMKTLILMNGICVWHEPFENKYSSFLNYYIIRNQLIDNAFHCQWFNSKHLIKIMRSTCAREVLLYRYKNVDLYLRGINDFLKGPEYLMQLDGEQLHKDIMASGYRNQDLRDLDVPFSYPVYEDNLRTGESSMHRKKRKLLLNGIFFRAKGSTIVPVEKAWTLWFYRKKKVLQYDIVANKGFVTEKSLGKTISCMVKVAIMSIRIRFSLKKAQSEYRTKGLKLRTIDFWNKYLGLIGE